MRTQICLLLTVLLLASVEVKAQQDVYTWRLGLKGGIATNSNAITYPKSLNSYFYGIQIQPRLSPSFSMRLDLNKSFFKARALQHDSRMLLAVVYTFDNNLIIRERAKVAPYIALGGGYANYSAKYVELSIANSDWVAAGEIGVKFRVTDRFNINLFSSLQYALNNANFSSFGGGGLTQQFGISAHVNFRLRKSDFKAPSYYVGTDHEEFNPVPEQRSLLSDIAPAPELAVSAKDSTRSSDSKSLLSRVDSLELALQRLERVLQRIEPDSLISIIPDTTASKSSSISVKDNAPRFSNESEEQTAADRLQIGDSRAISDQLSIKAQPNRTLKDTAHLQTQRSIPAQPNPQTVLVVQSPQQAPASQPYYVAPYQQPSNPTYPSQTQPTQSTPSNINVELKYPSQQTPTPSAVVGVPVPVGSNRPVQQVSTMQDSVMLEMVKTLRAMQTQLSGSGGIQPLTNADATNQQLVSELVKAQAESNKILKDRIAQLEGQPKTVVSTPSPVNVVVNQKETKVVEKPAVVSAPQPVLLSGSKLMDVYFPVNRWSISADQREILADLAKTIKADSTLHVIISGFADNLGENEYNDKISKFRAEAVWQYMKSRGVSEKRLKLQYYGKKFATGPTNMDDRKVEIEILTKP